MYAVIETGGKQYKVEPNEKITVELLDVEVGKKIDFVDLLNGAKVLAKVVEHGRGEKLNIFKYKPKKNERKRMGHRQPFTILEIEAIGGVTAEKPKAEKPAKAVAAKPTAAKEVKKNGK
jgi:large subunit ribosomal protein L21